MEGLGEVETAVITPATLRNWPEDNLALNPGSQIYKTTGCAHPELLSQCFQ